jgi:hypothetical protein
VAETGGNSGIQVENIITEVLRNPSEGKPSLVATPGVEVAHEKVKWANGYITQLFGDEARLFKPTV